MVRVCPGPPLLHASERPGCDGLFVLQLDLFPFLWRGLVKKQHFHPAWELRMPNNQAAEWVLLRSPAPRADQLQLQLPLPWDSGLVFKFLLKSVKQNLLKASKHTDIDIFKARRTTFLKSHSFPAMWSGVTTTQAQL